MLFMSLQSRFVLVITNGNLLDLAKAKCINNTTHVAHVTIIRAAQVAELLAELVETAQAVAAAMEAHTRREEASLLPQLQRCLHVTAKQALVRQTLQARARGTARLSRICTPVHRLRMHGHCLRSSVPCTGR